MNRRCACLPVELVRIFSISSSATVSIFRADYHELCYLRSPPSGACVSRKFSRSIFAGTAMPITSTCKIPNSRHQNGSTGRTFSTTTGQNEEILECSQPLNTHANKDDRELTVDYWRGLPRITLLLPSRKEKCRFILKPISNTVGDFIRMVQEEDKGIDRVVLLTRDGVRIASSNTIELLMQEGEFELAINDERYTVRTPPVYDKSFTTKDDLQKLSDVKTLVYQLYETLDIKEFHVHKEKELVSKIEEIKVLLEPLEQKREELEKKAGSRTSLLTWAGLGMMSVQFGILARLTWWEYSWDIMEPVTYFVTYGTAMAAYAYFAVTKQDYVLPDVRDRQYLIILHKKAQKLGFDLERYNTLRDQLAQVQNDLNRLRDPVLHHHHDPFASPQPPKRCDPSPAQKQPYNESIRGETFQILQDVLKMMIEKTKKKMKPR